MFKYTFCYVIFHVFWFSSNFTVFRCPSSIALSPQVRQRRRSDVKKFADRLTNTPASIRILITQQVRKSKCFFYQTVPFFLLIDIYCAIAENMRVERTHQMNRIIWIVATFSLLHSYFIFYKHQFSIKLSADFVAFYCIQIRLESRKSIN